MIIIILFQVLILRATHAQQTNGSNGQTTASTINTSSPSTTSSTFSTTVLPAKTTTGLPSAVATTPKPTIPPPLTNQQIINVGLLFIKDAPGYNTTIAYKTSAGAVLIAEDRIRQDHLLDGYKFNYTIMFDEAKEMNAGGMSVDMFRDESIDVIIGPSTTTAGLSAAALAAYYNTPIFLWGQCVDIGAADPLRMPTAVLMSVTTYHIAIAIRETMLQYNWTTFSFLYSTATEVARSKCINMKNDVMNSLANFDVPSMSTAIELTDMNHTTLTRAINNVSQLSRIIVVCLAIDNYHKRAFMLAASDANKTSSEYVYIIADTRSKGWKQPQEGSDDINIWMQSPNDRVQDGRNMEAREAFSRVLVVTHIGLTAETPEYLDFANQAINRMADPPFYCTTECNGAWNKRAGIFAFQVHDAFYAYALSLNWTIGNATNVRDVFAEVINNGTRIAQHFEMSFDTTRGSVIVDKNGLRTTRIFILGIGDDDVPVEFSRILVNRTNGVTQKSNLSANVLWKNWDGKIPRSMPKCGYLNNLCPRSFLEQYLALVIALSCLFAFIIIGVIVVMYLLYRARVKEVERQDLLWQIPYQKLQTLKKGSKTEASFRSLQSGPSISTRTTVESKQESAHFAYFLLQQEMVAARKHLNFKNIDEGDRVHLRQLRQLDHDNLCRFLGLVLDGPILFSIWRYCYRGSVKDVIAKSTVNMDAFFVGALMRDIATGLGFIHNSYLKYHGLLSSETCLVDDRWQVKIGYYGMQNFINTSQLEKKDLLWTAPEHLRNMGSGSVEGDVYSFAIICSELVTRKSAWAVRENGDKEAAILHAVKKYTGIPKRPDLTQHDSLDMNAAILHMIRDCWSERPSERPTMDQVKSILKSLEGRNFNLMDHVFNLLESYAQTLEEEVEERTKELTEEKKRSDVLLHRMLPKQVAERLKLGQSVPPESFDNVTVFFSDVVSFTTLASKCTPLQVVTVLNDLYTIFDRIIDEHNVYKVETIGDGYLCVSGLPHRNGNEHIRKICSMALGFLENLVSFRVAHLPNERISLRVGIHSGPVVAGVVGLTMPRYCLFGDTVNTASRMESNGKADRIHLSPEANRMVQLVGGFTTEPRGDVIIKGKGVMETYWLLSKSGAPPVVPPQPIMKQKLTRKPLNVPEPQQIDSDCFSDFDDGISET